jgi:hypothetical protein
MLYETSFQIINIYFISCQNEASELPILFKDTELEKLSLYIIQLRVRNSCVEGEQVKCFTAIAGGEEPR